jgi:hypothetical protein
VRFFFGFFFGFVFVFSSNRTQIKGAQTEAVLLNHERTSNQ